MINQDSKLHSNECKCFSWRPIFAGALVAIGLTFLLNLFSVAIGLAVFSTDSQGIENLAFGNLMGMAIGIIASMFAAGWVAGYLSIRHCTKRHLGALYGFLTWVVALVVMIFFAQYIQQYLTYYTQSLSGPVVLSAGTTGVQVAAVKIPAKAVVISTYIVFVLFFLSAFSASLGGHLGMRYISKEERSAK